MPQPPFDGTTHRASSSTSTPPPNHPSCSAACTPCATSHPHDASSIMNRRRSNGHFGSSGRYAPPDSSAPITPTTCSSERCSCSATTQSGSTPCATSHDATCCAQPITSAYVSVAPCHSSATAPGVAAACAATMWWMH
eukprot:3719840-Prymnesium_polylepis.2